MMERGTVRYPVNWSYVAGLVDGEGCINAYIDRWSSGRTGIGFSLQAQVVISNSSKPLIERVGAFLGHKDIDYYIHIEKRSRAKRGGNPTSVRFNPVYRLQIAKSKTNILRFIDNILPYCIAKEHQLLMLHDLVQQDIEYGEQIWTPERLRRTRKAITRITRLNAQSRVGRSRSKELDARERAFLKGGE